MSTEYGARKDVKREPQVETVNLNRAEIIRASLVTTHDLDHHLNEVNEWIEDYVALGRESGR